MELAAAKLALSTLWPIINKLGSYVYDSYLGGDVTADEIQNLKNVVLFKIKTVIQEAELVPLDQLRPWLDSLQAAAREADDLLDLYEYKQIKNQVSSVPKFMKKSIGITKKTLGFIFPKSSLKVSLEKLQKSAEEAEKLLPLINCARNYTMRQLEYKSPQASSGSATTSNISSPLFGRKKECDNLIEFLLEEPHTDSNRRIKKVPIIAIKGIGGSGKTTTAQGVYNEEKVKDYFDLSMWIHVSRSFDVHRLTKEIMESMDMDSCPQINNLSVLQTRLKEKISKSKKFLLVLDDVWCEDIIQWDQLLCPLNEVGGIGSKIIITTRMEQVGSILQVENVVPLQELKTEDCWSILKHYASFDNYENIDGYHEFENIGNQIISKVKHSPLALRVVGSLLGKRVNVNEWKKILKQDMLKKTMDALLLSFLHLPLHLQRCFAYCSLFPKAHKFYSGQVVLLIYLWAAQGFIENGNENELTLEEKGNIYFEELQSYSFFEKHGDGFHSYYVIHDLLHDLAEKVSKNHCHRIEDHDSLSIPTTCIHLSIYKTEDLLNIDIPNISNLKELRTLLIVCDAQFTNIFKNKNNFQYLTKLRALYVESDFEMEVLSTSCIDKLKHLRYIHLQHDKMIPRSLAKLYHLQFFYLAMGRFQNFRLKVPRGFGNLINLRVLTFYIWDSKKAMEYLYHNSEMSTEKLTSLQKLVAFRPRKDNGMIQLKNLPLHGALSIRDLENVKSEVEAAKALLNQKKNLRKLTFEWNSTSNTCEEVLEGLEPHPNLEKLTVRRYQGVKVSKWMMKENWLPRLLNLELYSCGSLKEVPYLPPRLEYLHVEDCNELMQLPPVGSTLCTLKLHFCSKLVPPSMANNSLRLVHLEIIRCSRNISQIFNNLPFLTNLQVLFLVGFPNIQILPDLSPSMTNLWIKDFPELTSMGNLTLITSLEDLRVENCPMLITDEPSLVE